MRKLIPDILNFLGFSEVELAENGQHAVDLSENFIPDLIITDYNMEPVNGLELTQLVRAGKTGAKSDIPVIIISPSFHLQDCSEAVCAGVSRIFMKPVTIRTMVAELNEVL